MAAPTVALAFGVELPQTNMMISEEETHNSPITFSEKTLPATLNVHDFLKFFQSSGNQKAFLSADEHLAASPYSSVISPPPEA
ncbi:hypothetical protein CO230_10890 [Chryseobacterium sp. 6424]|nr:hypothetical protein CO230_10890 [Chryseobacterium sp. 6424]